MGLGSFISGAWHATENFFDPDTSVPAGTNPAQIYQWFHQGAGTSSYQTAAGMLQPTVGSMKNYQSYLTQAQQALSSGWSGSAADAAQQSFAPLNTSAQSVAAHGEALHTHLTAQISQFNDTKGKVVNVPTTPPSGPGLADYVGMATPMGAAGMVSADASVSSYQNDAHGNQQAYQGYQGPTNTQASGLPQGGSEKKSGPVTPPVNQPPSANPVQLGGNPPSAHGGQYSRSTNPSGHYPGSNGMPPGNGASPNWPGLGQNNPNGLSNSGTAAQGYAAPPSTAPPGAGPSGGGGFGPAGGNPAGGGFSGGPGYGSTGGGGMGAGSGARPAGGMGAGADAAAGPAAGGRGASMPRGGGGRRQQDKEHKTAGYLQENDPDAIFGTDQKTVPPVIGG